MLVALCHVDWRRLGGYAWSVNYADALSYILGFSDYERHIGGVWPATRFSLERVQRLCELLGRPQAAYPCVQVAGTKGKGSTAAMIQAALQAGGYRVGLFISPHLHCFRERVRVGDEMIGEDELASLTAEIKPHVDELSAHAGDLGSLTTFEVLTTLALLHFSRRKVDVAVLEAGLGGRLDSTSVVRPAVAVITSISLDHTHVLGDTIAQIAGEKAGIIKEGALVVSAPQRPDAAEVLGRVARERGATLLLGERDWRWWDEPGERGRPLLGVSSHWGTHRGLIVGLLGRHQLINAGTAVVALCALRERGLALDDAAIAAGLRRVVWPGRLEVVGERPTLVVDGAHNDDSARRLREALAEVFRYRRLILVLGTSADKDVAGIIRELAPAAEAVVVTRSRHPRSAPTEQLAGYCRGQVDAVVEAADVPAALARALARATPEDLVCVTGSLFVVAEAREALGLAAPC